MNNTRGLKFHPGEDRLHSVTRQLKANGIGVDDRFCYKADGVLRCSNEHREMELTLLETSNGYNQADQTKISLASTDDQEDAQSLPDLDGWNEVSDEEP